MIGYVLSIVGIVVAGVLIDIIVPSGTLNKYIKGVYSIFVIAVLISPITKLMHKAKNFTIQYEEYAINENLLNYIGKMQTSALENDIEKILTDDGFSNTDITLTFSIENDLLKYVSCKINLKKLVISTDKQHINKYEYIKGVVIEKTNLSETEIIIDEWERKENK